MINNKCGDNLETNIAPLVEQAVGYRLGHPGIPILDLPFVLPVGLSADWEVREEAGSLFELKTFNHDLLDDRADVEFFDMTNQKKKS